MASRKFKLPGFSEYLEEVTQITAREAATAIVGDLVFLSPWYSGEFASNWVVRVGDKEIKPTVDEKPSYERTPRQTLPAPVVPSLRGTGSKKNVGYTIGNLTKYRNVALDLVPGRTEQAREISAPQDWYRTYVEGGTMQKRLGVAVAKASQNPRIKGFKSFSAKQSFIGPLRLVNQ
jgi:hypothetical protein